MTVLRPGSTVGILGAGQLGRMLALAAAPLGLHVHVFAPEADGPAFEVARRRTVAEYEDDTALIAFADAVDVVTTEFENVPAHAAEVLAARVPVRPNPRALAIAQDRLVEKSFIRDLGVPVPPFDGISTPEQLAAAMGGDAPRVLKTRRLGYDGKGQVVVRQPRADGLAAWDRLGRVPVIAEDFVPFVAEVSVVAARGVDGAFAAYDLVRNVHRDHILATSTVPAGDGEDALAAAATATAQRIADGLGYVGVLAVEFFVAADGRLLVNEIAPRVHNSGHWTIEGAETSQFEQHVRAVAGWPLGATRRRAPRVVMENLVGAAVERWPELLAEPGARLHLYGKAETRAGRKMGHVTRLLDT